MIKSYEAGVKSRQYFHEEYYLRGNWVKVLATCQGMPFTSSSKIYL